MLSLDVWVKGLVWPQLDMRSFADFAWEVLHFLRMGAWGRVSVNSKREGGENEVGM